MEVVGNLPVNYKDTYATILGEATSGNVNHYGEVRSFQLPRTKISVGYSTR